MFLKVLYIYGIVTSIQDLFCDAKVAKFENMIAAVGVLFFSPFVVVGMTALVLRDITLCRYHKTFPFRCCMCSWLQLQCLYCTEKFRFISPLKEHILAKHPKAFPFKCSICQRGFSRDSSRFAHEQTHQTEKLFFCSECGEGFTLQTYLNRHMKYRHLKLVSGRKCMQIWEKGGVFLRVCTCVCVSWLWIIEIRE